MTPAKARPLVVALLFALAVASPLRAQEDVLTAGGEGVPVPKKTKHVQPVYPAEALAQGIRGIVILDIVVDGRGKVASTSVLRSVAGLDEAAIAAARQWEYEPTKLDGKPVSVRLTVPITFSLALPRLLRQAGVPELRQGVTPAFPSGDAAAGGSASAEVTLEPDGRIADASLLSGGPPWSEALLAALRTWRFSPPPDDAVVSFRVEADFVRGRGSEPNSVVLRANGLQRSELLAGQASPQAAPAQAAPAQPAPTQPAPTQSAPTQPAPTQPASATPAPPQPAPAPPAATPAGAAPAMPAPASPASAAPAVPAAPVPGVPAGAPPVAATTPRTAQEGGMPPAAGVPPAAGATAPPPVEVITAPPPAPPAENGVSAIRDVTLEPGVPDLARGRRPVAPPFARMSGTTGTVEVSFSVSAGGTTALQTASGPEMLRFSAEQTVASWVFRRTRADRAYLIAHFNYDGDKATAVVRPHPAPSAAQPAEAPATKPLQAPPAAASPTAAAPPAASAPPATSPPATPPPATPPPRER